jgi:SAM-dependent methyltransferase
MAIPSLAQIDDKLRSEDLDAWLHLWHTEQGPAKPAALKLIASAIPFATDRRLCVLDVGCGPGDAGRAVRSRFAHARIDSVDRNEFFVALCGAVNRRNGIEGRTWVGDLSQPDWRCDLTSDYDVVLAVNAVHWLSREQCSRLLGDILRSLRSGGTFLLMEPVATEPLFAPGFSAWRSGQPSQHKYEDWRRFWSRVQALVGHDFGFLGDPPDQDRIGDGLSTMQWVGLLADAGFQAVDVLLRDAEKLVLAGVKA